MDLTDPRQFARVYDEHAPSAERAAMRILGSRAAAQDVVQDVFLRVWRNPRKFDAARGGIGPYLRLMARSRALDVWREGQAAGRASDRLKVVVDGAEAPLAERPADAAERRIARGDLATALGTLPDEQREAVVLAYWGGLSAGEIATRIRVPLGTAKSRVRLGLAKLRDEVARTGILDDSVPTAA